MQAIYSRLSDKGYIRLRRLIYWVRNHRKFKRLVKKRAVLPGPSYSFRPYEETNSIFIHIPKCAGVSVCNALYGNLAGGHATLMDCMYAFEPAQFLGFFKFTVARNPWDRVVSAYHFLKKGGMNERDRQWAQTELADYSDFESFVKGWLTRENIWKYLHFFPQVHFFQDDMGRLKVDFIAYLENIQSDFDVIREEVGVKAEMPVSNKGQHADYTGYYTDELRDIVADVYREDIAALGYQFDNANLSSMVSERDKRYLSLCAPGQE